MVGMNFFVWGDVWWACLKRVAILQNDDLKNKIAVGASPTAFHSKKLMTTQNYM
jgi:hypothetical protein